MLVKSLEIAILVLVLANFSCVFARSIQSRLQRTTVPLITTESVYNLSVSHFQDEFKVNDTDEVYVKNSVPIMVIDIDTKQIGQKPNEIPKTTRSPSQNRPGPPEPVIRSGSIGDYLFLHKSLSFLDLNQTFSMVINCSVSFSFTDMYLCYFRVCNMMPAKRMLL